MTATPTGGATAAGAPQAFDPATLEGFPEPVRRYLGHALAPGAALWRGVRLGMTGRIRLGAWLPFRATWEGDGRSLAWAAAVGPGRRPLLRVLDRFDGAAGSMDVRLRGRVPLVRARGEDVTRSAAGRAALEAMWAPASLLPARGVTWRAEGHDVVVASRDAGPERPEVHLRVGPDGALRSTWASRWRGGDDGYVPFGADVHAERRFGDLTIPAALTAGWWYGTARWAPFFRCEIVAVAPLR